MSLESLTLVHPTDAARNITLNGTKWGLEELDLGNPSRREDLITSLDASGGYPARVSTRDNREVTARLRLLDATTVNGALDSIGTLERLLLEAEEFAAADPTDPVLDCVRLVYKPATSTYAYSLIVLAAEIADVPKTLTGDDAGWFIKRPVVTIRAICDPFAYGADVTSPTRTTFLDATTGGTALADSYRVPASGGIAGDVSPWTRIRVKDVASTIRNRLVIGVRRNEANTTPTIAAGSMTTVAGSLSSGTITTTSNDYVVAASIPQQTRKGTFRLYLSQVTSTTTGSVRFIAAESGAGRRVGPAATIDNAGTYEVDLGEVSMGSTWDGWIETTGTVSFTTLILVPTDSFIQATGAAPGQQMTGAVTLADTLTDTFTDISGRSLTTGGGTWSKATTGTATGNWSGTATGARRTTTNQLGVMIAVAHTTDILDVDVRWTSRTTRSFDTATLTTGLLTGAVARYVGSTSYLFAGWTSAAAGTGDHANARPTVIKSVSGTSKTLWTGDIVSGALFGNAYDWNLQATADGRWYVEVSTGGALMQSASGQDVDLIQGGALGDTAECRTGLLDAFALSTPSMTRDITNFRASPLAGVTQPPIPSGATVTLAGPKMLTANNAELPYLGSSGIQLRPGSANNLTLFARRSSGLATSTTNKSDALDVDIDGWPRFLSVPHS